MATKKAKTEKTRETPKPEVAETPKAETAKPAKKKADPKPKKTSALDAAAKVLGEAGQPMTCMEMIEAMSKKGYWTSPGGATPQATPLLGHIARDQNQGERHSVPENRAGEVRHHRIDAISARFDHEAPTREPFFVDGVFGQS